MASKEALSDKPKRKYTRRAKIAKKPISGANKLNLKQIMEENEALREQIKLRKELARLG